MWKLSYSAPVGKRINRYWRGVCVYTMNDEQDHLWWIPDLNKWCLIGHGDEGGGFSASSSHSGHNSPKSVKAFKNYLDRHPELKGYEVIFANKYYTDEHGLSITATWEE